MNSDLTAQSERAVLGPVMLDNTQWSHARTLSTSDFLLSSHSLIFGCMNSMLEDQRSVDNVTLAQELEKIGKLESVGGYAYLSQLIGEGITVLDVAANVRYVKEASTERKWKSQVDLLTKASSPETRSECVSALVNLCNGTAFQSAGDLIVVRGDQAKEKPLRWMWKHYFPLGKLVHCVGESSQAKSPVTVNLAARVSIAAEWPDRTKNTLGPRSVIMLNVEDDFEDTILPRFRAAGGDKSKLYYVKGTQVAATIIAFAAFTGTRRSEIQGLRWEDYRDGGIYVSRSLVDGVEEETKTKASAAPIPVIPSLAKILETHRLRVGSPTTGPIFAATNKKPVSLNNVLGRAILPALKRDGLVQWQGWHAFRRGLATNLHDLGVDDKTIQAILRHSDVSVTQKCYVKTLPKQTVAAMQMLESALCAERAPGAAVFNPKLVN